MKEIIPKSKPDPAPPTTDGDVSGAETCSVSSSRELDDCITLITRAAFSEHTEDHKWSEIIKKVEFFFPADVVEKAGKHIRGEIS